MNRLFKTSTGNLRWGWKALILLLGSLLFGILLNTVWMAVLSIVYSAQGLAREQAMAKAALSANGFLVQVVLSVCQLVFMLWLVYWLVTKVEKQKFEWSMLGLISLDRSKYVLLGTTLAIVLSVLTLGMGLLAGTLEYLGNGFELFALLHPVGNALNPLLYF